VLLIDTDSGTGSARPMKSALPNNPCIALNSIISRWQRCTIGRQFNGFQASSPDTNDTKSTEGDFKPKREGRIQSNHRGSLVGRRS
jgi:hypothetical protein